ncbi:BTAD domain-containing putative transcriptional regulator [Actinoplanes sp. L3-i22]|uniref:AfsR/SARP family transcriptional regulator n=1 Tax=Actinoplanes sp. L3-i22 TaxID=2836373 RepID=UPI001C862565|nr:BTAD domain-containing putative transcriptional regulator [Actinoplanes sp. L3-i22]
MRVRLLGSVDVEGEGVPRPVSGLRRRAVLAVLALAAGEVVSTDHLIDVVWNGRPPATARNTLQSHVSYLRRMLGGRESIVARAPGYLLTVGTDLQVAADLIEESRQTADPDRKVARLGAALNLWRGPPLAGLTGLSRLEGEAERLAGIRLDAVRALLDARLARGEHAAVVPELTELIRHQPHHEHLHGQLMLALYRAGRQADALRVYQRLRRSLADDLGVDPGTPVSELQAAVLRHDPSLDPPEPRTEPDGRDGSVPRQLPGDVPGFTGRDSTLAELDALLEPAAEPCAVRVAAITGTAGVGKTALAVHWAHRAAGRFPDGQLFVNLRGFAPEARAVDPAEAVRQFLDALGVPAGRIPADPDAQAALYRTRLAGRRTLIVLDNARDSAQVRPLLPGSPDCLVVVTSRHELSGLVAEGARPIGVELPAAAEARELLVRRIGAARAAAEPDAVDEMVARSARLPLALTVVAARAAIHPRLPLRTVAAEMRNAGCRLAVLTGDDPSSDVRAVFSWSYRALTPPAARLFRLLSLHPGPDLSAPGAAALAGVPVERVRPMVEELARASLLMQHAAGRYGFHDLLCAYASGLAEQVDPAEDRGAAVRRVLDHYFRCAYASDRLLYPARDPLTPPPAPPAPDAGQPGDEQQALTWFAAEHRTLLAAVHLAVATHLDDRVWRLAWTMVTFLNRTGHWHDLTTVGFTALAAGRRLGDQFAQAQAHCFLAYAKTRLGHFEAADTELRQALALFDSAGDRAGRAHVHLNLAYTMDRRGRWPDALGHARLALELYRSAGHERGRAIALNSVGWCHALLGQYEQARDCCLEALPLLVELGDRNGQADTWDSLGLAQARLGRHDEAIASYRHAVDLIQRLGDHYREATTLVNLGEAQHAAGDAAAAGETWCRALAILERLRHPDAPVLRDRLAGLAVPCLG